ncbi:helix-turn-helix domain-containing protein [Nocardia amamiensis]|uniref:helix-turn-helix domain-containing protein n=1 Tax=Nocardia amamiensis TaxID=404578 RepID=UPI000835354F|nr:helix-turn-helix transcriptional regulator [Nocardia amamiensis]
MTIDGREIKSARTERGWSQAQLLGAMRTQAAQQAISLMTPESLRVALSRWENGHTKPDTVHSRLLRQVLELPSRPMGTPETDSLFGVLENHTNSLRLLDRRFGAPAARLQTAAHVTALETMWQNAAGADRTVIARAQADAAALAAWQDFDVGDFVAATEHYALARTAASRADDVVLLAHTIGEESVMLAETGRASAALGQIARAERMPGLPPLLRSWLSATRAQVTTYSPGMSAAAREALTIAEVLLPDRQGEDNDLPFIAHDATHLARWAGHILAQLGDPAAAAITRESMRAIPEDFVRARCAQQLDLAQSAISADRREEAASLLSVTADRIAVLGSGRLRRRHELLSRRTRHLATAV